MNKRISYISPLQTGKVLAVLYALFALILVPFFLLFAIFAPHEAANGSPAMFQGGFAVMAIVLPIFYGVAGFIGGIIAAAIYNLVAGWTGGLEFTVVDVPPALTGQTVLPPTPR